MTTFLELRERLKVFCGKYERYVFRAGKFLLSLCCFFAIRNTLGSDRLIDHVLVLLILSAVCMMLDVSVTVIVSGIFIIIQLLYISPQLAFMMALLFVLMFLLYFAFAPEDGSILLLAAILCAIKLPFLTPVCAGLTKKPNSAIPTAFGIVIYYGLKVMGSASLKSGAADSEDSIMIIAINQIVTNKEFLLVLAVSIMAVLVVYGMRRLSIDYSWQIAIGFGMLCQLLSLLIGNFVLSLHMSMLWLFVGCLISTIVAVILQCFLFELDYKRTEYVQFEDDEYYYYVKAVPKISVSTKEVKVKNINTAKKTVSKEMLADELEIDKDLLD